jgi:TonB-linked SusC/RagA family outer membrane protein
MKSIYSLLTMLLLFASGIYAQTIKGKVYNEEGKELANASVIEKSNPENGTLTDNSGRFTLVLKGTAKIITVQYVGYLTQDITVTGNDPLVVKLKEDVKGLEDVVVVGYGRQKKMTKTGAISSISGDNIRQTPSASLQNTLVGKVPGFAAQIRTGKPGADGAQFYVRGISTFNGSGQPLILVDDIEYTYSQFSRLDANEVASITVLKDAATTAIYGIRGANGVVLVTTRRGKSGRPKVTLSNQFAISSPTIRRQYLGAYDVARLRNEAASNDFGGIITTPADSVAYSLFSQADLDAFKNGTDPYGHPDVNWYDAVYKNQSLMSTTNIDVTGGSERIKYFISGGYLWQNGMLRHYKTDDNFNNNFYYKRYNFRSNLDLQATKNLQLRLNLAGSFGETNQPLFNSVTGDPFLELAGFVYITPYSYPIFNPDGSYGWSSKFSNGQNNIVGRLSRTGYNRSFENIMNLNISGIEKLDRITKGLSARVTLAYSTSNTASRELRRGDAFPSYNYNPQTQTYTIRNANETRLPLLSLSTSNGSPVRRLNLQAALDYQRRFGVHGVTALALFNQTADVATSSDPALNNVPAKFRGYTFRAGYDYRQKYLLELTGAYNGTDRFQAAKRFGFFPAVGLGWNVAEESFLKNNLRFIDLFKFRGSWGIVGSDDIGSYRYIYQQVYTQSNGSYNFGESPNSFNSIFEGQIGNTDVRWEKERKVNVGVDFSLFSGKLSGTVEVFDNYRYDILAARGRTPVLFGQTLPVVNLGEVSNKGYEVELSHRSAIGKVEYNLKGTYSVAKNKILFMDEPAPLFPWQQRTGKPIGLVSGGLYIFDGFYQDAEDIAKSPKPASGSIIPGMLKYKDINGDGVISSADQSVTGLPNLPQTTFGLNMGVSYKNISLNFLFQGAKDYNFRMIAEAIDAFHANLQPIHLRSWHPGDGNSADYPVLRRSQAGLNSSRDYPSTFWSVNAWYIRLRSAELAYSFPNSITDRLGLDGLRVYVNGANLLTWSNILNRYGYDPETESGVDGRGLYPQQKLINFGINVSFK